MHIEFSHHRIKMLAMISSGNMAICGRCHQRRVGKRWTSTYPFVRCEAPCVL